MPDDFFDEDDAFADEPEPSGWRPPTVCPNCYGSNTRLITLVYEMSRYVCEDCRTEFETEEPLE